MIDPCQLAIQHWWQWHPPVGTYIGVLGVLGVIVPWLFRPLEDMRRGEKALWTLVVFALFGLELRTLYLDRDEHDAEQAQARCQQLQSFQQIATGLETAIKDSQTQFDFTMKKENGILDTTESVSVLAKRSLENITGGNSFGFVVPQPWGEKVPLLVWNHGDQPLIGVTLTIARTQDQNWDSEFYRPIFIGTIGPHDHAPVPGVLSPSPDEKSGLDNYWIMISAQNGTVSESLNFRKNHKGVLPWAYSYEVTKAEILKGSKGEIPKGATVMQPLLMRHWSDDVDEPH